MILFLFSVQTEALGESVPVDSWRKHVGDDSFLWLLFWREIWHACWYHKGRPTETTLEIQSRTIRYSILTDSLSAKLTRPNQSYHTERSRQCLKKIEWRQLFIYLLMPNVWRLDRLLWIQTSTTWARNSCSSQAGTCKN